MTCTWRSSACRSTAQVSAGAATAWGSRLLTDTRGRKAPAVPWMLTQDTEEESARLQGEARGTDCPWLWGHSCTPNPSEQCHTPLLPPLQQ